MIERKDNRTVFSIRSSILFILFFLFIAINSCVKDDVVDEQVEVPYSCTPIPPYSQIGLGYNYIVENPQYTSPSFNPNSDNEFLYVLLDNSVGVEQIFTFNLLTQTNELIYTGDLWSKPLWGKNGWILFQKPDQNVWKIKSDGNSLTQLTFVGNCFYPKWNQNADLIIYQKSFGVDKAVLMSPDGSFVDTLDNISVGAVSSWNHPLYLGGVDHTDVKYYNPYSDAESISIYELESEENRAGFEWMNDDIYFSENSGIYKVGIGGGEPVRIKASCNAVKYIFPTVNMSKNKLLWMRIDQELIDAETVATSTNIVIMNPDGTGEAIVAFP